MVETRNNKRYTQARGRARREALLTAARALLEERAMHEITLPMIAERAAIPTSSTYHFFPDIRVLYKELARNIADEMSLMAPEAIAYERWQDCVSTFLRASAAYFNSDAAARQLLLGPQSASDIKRAACHDDLRFGAVLSSVLESFYHLPQMKDPVLTCFYAVQIADTFFSLSVLEDGIITKQMLDQAIIGSTSYLANYLPPLLEMRHSPTITSEARKTVSLIASSRSRADSTIAVA
ncbi:MAG: TetR family transcriptional regulator [Sphingobium sp.]|uniref:TetR/AcrR family transcriptional regulator n=1 Tax=Sphingobium sp. CECT 9361 TaxID=2845384 RepID=UPI0025B6EF80|nr:TetR family transcriptional regulator [Sphingobium sp. CECT 9361]